jgi:hypothetical protein
VVTFTSSAAQLVASHSAAIVMDEETPNIIPIDKALKVAGYKGPIITTVSGTDDSIFAATPSLAHQIFVTRDTETLTPGTPLWNAAVAAHASTTQGQINTFFGKEYADIWIIADVLRKCGATCSPSHFVSTLRSLGPIHIPLNTMLGTVNFSSGGVSGTHFAQGFGWDPAKKASKTVTPVLTFSG